MRAKLGTHPYVMNPTTTTHWHFVLSPVSLSSRDEDGGWWNSTIGIYDLTEKYGDCEQSNPAHIWPEWNLGHINLLGGKHRGPLHVVYQFKLSCHPLQILYWLIDSRHCIIPASTCHHCIIPASHGFDLVCQLSMKNLSFQVHTMYMHWFHLEISLIKFASFFNCNKNHGFFLGLF